jgi:hypothetical protein
LPSPPSRSTSTGPLEIRGIRALHVPPAATRIELPTVREAAGKSQAAIILPEELREPIGDAVIARLVELGLAVKRSASTSPPPPDARAVALLG